MNSQESIIDNSSNWQSLKEITIKLVDFLIICFEALIAKVIESCHLTRLMIASQQINSV